MTRKPAPTTPPPALELRRAIADVYLRPDPPPGQIRAGNLLLKLIRDPQSADDRARAVDLLAAADLYDRLAEALGVARAAGDAPTALVIHGLIGHATAALLGSTNYPGWRAAALDLLDPDGAAPRPVDTQVAARLLALATADGDEPEAGG